ncbi:MAG: glycogen debranching enzyme GlgX [Proteobacteria bacterium]|nr:MAG: glycogen debranching enzyme GlgX [Pseudomonadota bacterium]
MAPGLPRPLGAHYDGLGTNFAVTSEVAEAVDLCLFDARGRETRVAMQPTGPAWHTYVPGTEPGQRYGFRVHGPWQPAAGLRCNAAKLLIDPYARAIDGDVDWHRAVFGHKLDAPHARNDADSARHVPKSVVINPWFDWGADARPRTPWTDTVLYELHVKGATALHPAVPEALRGTYAGLAHPAMLEHLQRLGVTAVELLPVHQFVHDSHLLERGLRNYWGYNSIGFFAPHHGYAASGKQVAEFKAMVRALHAAGIEVILDVVFNHTAEGNHLGPTLCFKGLDNGRYYRLVEDDPQYYMDFTGTGNTLHMRSPHVLQLVMDSLRYWVLEMHVDGFRFDLASALARDRHHVDDWSPFFDVIQQDPVLADVKRIAEPWDLGEGGYRVGQFPAIWSEWNGCYRDDVRDWWRGEGATARELAHRFTGSPDLYAAARRRPRASVNFVTAHDGFTLRDLVSYNEKHNEANGEDNRDGESHNRSWNCGAEGPSDDPEVLALRARQQRNFLATLLLSQGVPMLCAGDELGRTQQGNNNAYCQDNELSWIDWKNADAALLDWTRALIELRRTHPIVRRTHWLHDPLGTGGGDAHWFRPDGEPPADWDGAGHSIGVQLDAAEAARRDGAPERDAGDSLVLLFNAWWEPVEFRLPAALAHARWQRVLDSAGAPLHEPSDGAVRVEGRSLSVLKLLPPEPAESVTTTAMPNEGEGP